MKILGRRQIVYYFGVFYYYGVRLYLGTFELFGPLMEALISSDTSISSILSLVKKKKLNIRPTFQKRLAIFIFFLIYLFVWPYQ